MSKSVTRLFEQFQPEHYELALIPDRKTMTFSGTVTITGKKTGRPSQRLTFHQKDLTITKATVIKHDKKGDQAVELARINPQKSFDEVRLHTTDMIYPGNYTVTLEFTGLITRPMSGIYPCFFTEDAVEKQLIATQFESHYAREAFPCIDEPEAKATFDLTLTTPAGETVIANTPIKEQTTKNKALVTTFERTPRMSVYLLAFIFGELASKEATTKDGVLVRTFATRDNIEHTDFALDCAVKTLEFYNEYFDVPYPLPKCDFIALPDFASGAMENWGCITFREQAMLVDPANTSLHLKQYVANVVAHELTHQWFGNLVTMRWWTDLWLNESFASWMSWLAVDHLFPEWQVWTQFIVEEQAMALKLDALEHTHPIQVAVRHPDEIRTIFDAISYEKGASVLLQLFHYIGPEAFRDGLRLYLQKHAYASTDATDLWDAWGEVAKQPIRQFMTDWITKAGYPIVTVGVGEQLTLKQERFYLNPAAEKADTTWPIPLASSQPLQAPLLAKATDSQPLPANSDQLILNKDRTSFFRAIYNAEHLAGLDITSLDDVDRLGLLADAFEAAKAGYGPTVDALKLLESYRDETSMVVWDVIAGSVGSLRVVMDDDGVRAGLKPYIRKLAAPQVERLGWEERDTDSHFDKLLRPTVLGLASYGEDSAIVAEARTRFDTMTKPEDVHPDIRGVIYGTIARTGDAKDFQKMVKLHDEATNSEERVTLAGALTGFRQPELISQGLAKITGGDVRLQDVPYWVAYSFMNRHARQTSWQWLQDNWDWLFEHIGGDLSFFRMPIYAARGFSTIDFLPEFTKFFESHMSPGFDRPVKQAIETIQWQAAWKDRDLAAIRDYLKVSK